MVVVSPVGRTGTTPVAVAVLGLVTTTRVVVGVV